MSVVLVVHLKMSVFQAVTPCNYEAEMNISEKLCVSVFRFVVAADSSTKLVTT
jgi:hypothetical protein